VSELGYICQHRRVLKPFGKKGIIHYSVSPDGNILECCLERIRAKPDIAVKGYVEDCLGKKLSGCSVVLLMEAAAPFVPALRAFPQPVREADRRIWHKYNSKKKQSPPNICLRRWICESCNLLTYIY
jgi:hypothetical protein